MRSMKTSQTDFSWCFRRGIRNSATVATSFSRSGPESSTARWEDTTSNSIRRMTFLTIRSRSRGDDAHDQSQTLSAADATADGGSAPDSNRERETGVDTRATDGAARFRPGRTGSTTGQDGRNDALDSAAANAAHRGGRADKRGAREARNAPNRGGPTRATAPRSDGGRQNHDRRGAATGTNRT